ncbi:hypothetical protein B0O99DRAFT_504943 [Bisporella sp. PMI_857]|nr:hypothetical protein B0O99DRAFT_504943 [Bisporella sp. PMI_857]
MSAIQTLVTSDDEIVSTTEGLECIILQGVYHINIGNPRRAWLSYRRALNVAQLMGLHKLSSESDPGRRLWNQIVQADRYLALLLGLPVGSADLEIGPTETFQNPTMDKDLLFTRRLCIIAGQIVERNQAENIQAYAATQTLDEMLESLAKEMPKSWWTEMQFTNQNKSLDAAKTVDRLMIQIWYFQLETLLHLPFMLRSAKERKYDYSRFACLKAAREMTHRYLALRLPLGRKPFCCKVIDFGALTAVVTLFIGLLDSSVADEGRETKEQKESDRALIQTVLQSMEELVDGGKDVVATQSVNVIKTLLAVECPGSSTRNLRLTIPYFGTMNIIRSMPNPCNTDVAGLQHPPAIPEQSQPWQSLPFFVDKPATAPMVSFTSSQFAPLPPEQQFQNWDFPEADTLYFDSLLNSDIESNWIF